MAESKFVRNTRNHHKCQPCLKKDMLSSATIYCVECAEYKCYICSQIHHSYTSMSNHKTVSVSEGRNYILSGDGDDDEQTRYICLVHNKTFEFYCQQDDAFLCSKCTIISHKKCTTIVDIDTMDGHSGCEKLINKFVAAINSTNQVTELLDETNTRLSDRISNLNDKLKDMKARIIQIFDDFSNALLTQTTAYSLTTTNDLAGKKAQCDRTIQSLKKKIKCIECIMDTGTPAEKFITERKMKKEVQQALNDTTAFKNDIPSVDISCIFNEQFQKFESELLSFLELVSLNISFHLPAPSTLQLVKSVKLQKLQDDVAEPLYSGLDFLPDGRVVVADNKNDKCMIYDVNLNMKSSYKLSYPPLSVTTISNDEVVFTSAGKYRLDFLNVSKTNNITLNRTCKMNAKYLSISMMNDGSFLVGTIDHIKPFRIVSMSGYESDVGINLPDKKYQIGASFCTYIRGREKVVHGDKDDNTIFIYDYKSGERIVVKHLSIISPCGVAVGPYDHIFVCSNSTNCLVEITPCGRVLSSHQIGMELPCSVAISKDRKHFVVSNACPGDKILSWYKVS